MATKKCYDLLFEEDVDIDNRIIYIGDNSISEEIGPGLAAKVVKAMTIFNRAPDKEVTIYLNTVGGCVFNGYAIYDAIKCSRCHVTIYVLGSAMSMGTVILQAADKRISYPNATIMVHDGSVGLDSNVRSGINWAAYYEKELKRVYAILAARTGKSASYWKTRGHSDQIYTAAEALVVGLIDEIVE